MEWLGLDGTLEIIQLQPWAGTPSPRQGCTVQECWSPKMRWTMGIRDRPLNPRKTCRNVMSFGLFLTVIGKAGANRIWRSSTKWKCLAKRRQLVCVQLSCPGREFGQQLEELSGGSQCRCCPVLREGRAPGLSRVVGQEWRGLCPPVTDPVTVTLPNTTLAFTSRIFCSLISSSVSFQPREISLQVPALNPLT